MFYQSRTSPAASHGRRRPLGLGRPSPGCWRATRQRFLGFPTRFEVQGSPLSSLLRCSASLHRPPCPRRWWSSVRGMGMKISVIIIWTWVMPFGPSGRSSPRSSIENPTSISIGIYKFNMPSLFLIEFLCFIWMNFDLLFYWILFGFFEICVF